MTDTKRTVVPVDLDKDLEASVKRITELKAGRNAGDIPLDDEYWKALKKHQAAFGGR